MLEFKIMETPKMSEIMIFIIYFLHNEAQSKYFCAFLIYQLDIYIEFNCRFDK